MLNKPRVLRILSTFPALGILLVAASVQPASAATPSPHLNYQGVLRDGTGAPISGAYEMIFRFFSAGSGGDEIFTDGHLYMTMAGPVVVDDGLFSVTLGDGVTADGSGPGSYTDLGQVFRDYGVVWMEIQVGAETLSPRVEVKASAYALNASNLEGKPASSFLDISATDQSKAAALTLSNGSAEVTLPYYSSGIRASGIYDGGMFFHGTPSSYTDQAVLAHGGSGVGGFGQLSGGYFADLTGLSAAWLGYQYLESVGVIAVGDEGGRFHTRLDNNTRVDLAGPTPRSGTYGISAQGSEYAGEFINTLIDSSAYVADVWGVEALGSYLNLAGAGSFRDSVYTGHVQLARGDFGVVAYGADTAGVFRHGTEAGWDNWAHLADGTSAIIGMGAKNFVQNHPYDPGEEIVYSSLEGDEVGTYTRGSARLDKGVARVRLGETFAWVTNPDVGLTAVATSRGAAVALGIESLSTTELVVRGPDGAPDVTFDYVVQGLRAGFERSSVVRPRRGDAPVPPMTEHLAIYTARPELQKFSALDRFSAMPTAPHDPNGIDLSRGDALVAAIGVADMNAPPSPRRTPLTQAHEAQWVATHAGRSLEAADALTPGIVPAPRSVPVPPGLSPPVWPETTVDADSPPEQSAPATPPGPPPRDPRSLTVTLPVADRVEAGDVIVNDWARPGSFVRAREAGDPGVVGIIAGEPGARYTDVAPVALAGTVVLCRVDATDIPIETNDLLMASSLAGHAMRAGANPAQGTVVGKALEPMAGGTGLIKVLVMSR